MRDRPRRSGTPPIPISWRAAGKARRRSRPARSGRRAAGREESIWRDRITSFVIATYIASFAALILGWLKGGHPERVAVVALFASLVVNLFPLARWRIGDIYVDSTIHDSLGLLFFGWLAFRSDRWWPFVATAAMALTVMVHILTAVTDISWYAAVSARVGLGLLMNLAVLAGVAERWMAGEAPVSRIRRARP